ncbi:oligosaccharide flippase family protein [Pseudomonas sp. 21LCFQ010]|uniref:lipopolysaccharide biosynthesis protein n=1 Tax=Pseudomonas sp. 21LCFQ010 TaxID=2957506 RepID=UPI0020983411|nr:oligosaccharide flippase family protein [Pseudomonas sp. 21LCFQ010]MCO8165829.1 oligosaccharide flippase family protein [Pseudomonas sp. 21LCFQ010]
MSVMRNTLFNYAGQAYVLLVGIAVMPFYLAHLGAEAYGLIGFFTVLQAWLQLLDAGLSPSLVRAVTQQPADAAGRQASGRLLRSFELLFVPLTVGCALAVHLVSAWLASQWLNAQVLSAQTVSDCISLMGVIIALRLYATLYRSGLQGLEQHAWLNAANVLVATLRYFGALLLVSLWSQEVRDFFLFQVLVSLLESLLFAVRAWRQMPAGLAGFDAALVRPLMPFAASLSFTAILWIVLTQLDKVLLAERLPLDEYGYFALIALIATGLLTLTNPLVQTLLPRLARLMAENREADMHRLFLDAHRFVCTLLFPLAGIIALHGQALIYAWTGDLQAARWSQPVLGWYVLGSAIMAISGFQFYLQYAYGQIRLHVTYSLVCAVISVPLTVWAIHELGVLGAALSWAGLRLVSLAIWPLIVHRRLAPALHGPWLRDLLRISLMTLLGLTLSAPLFELIAGPDRFSVVLALALSGLLTLLPVTLSHRPLLHKIYLTLSKPST